MDPRNRRTVLKLVGLGVGGARAGFAVGQAQDEESPYTVVQGDRCIPVTPIAGSEPVEEFYDWAPTPEKRWSSNGTTGLQREDTSVAFLYEGPEATSLVFVHGKLGGDGTGGSVSFTIDGLPPDGEWVVEDDDYDGPNNYDNWHHVATASEVDWTWDGSRTDGGAFRGVTTDDTIRVVPRFNEGATLYGEYYQGDVERWEFLSGELDDPRRVELVMDEPLVVGSIDCDADGDGGSSGTAGQGDGGDDKQDRTHQREQEKHEEKQKKHQRKHEKKQKKHQKKHERKQRKHQEKHEKKQKKHQRKHEKKQRKHEEKEDDD